MLLSHAWAQASWNAQSRAFLSCLLVWMPTTFQNVLGRVLGSLYDRDTGELLLLRIPSSQP